MDRFQNKRIWIAGGALLAVLIVAASWFLAISPERSAAQSSRDDAANSRLAADVLRGKVHALQVKSRLLPKYTAALGKALETLPFDSGLPAFTRQVNAQAQQHNVQITSITVGAVAPLTPTTAAPSGDAGAAAGTDASTTPATDPTTASAAPGEAATASPGLYSIAVTLQSTGALSDQEALLSDIRLTGPRRALITSVQLASAVAGKANTSIDRSSSATVQASVFFTPQTPQQIAQLTKLLHATATR